jgi:putative sigma-54 modulation protein
MSRNAEPSFNISVTFRHTEPTDALKSYATEKLTHCLQKYVHHESDAHVILSVEKRDHIAEVSVRCNRQDFTSKASTGDLYAAIDKVVDSLGAQLRKQKERQLDQKHQPVDFPQG